MGPHTETSEVLYLFGRNTIGISVIEDSLLARNPETQEFFIHKLEV